VGTAAPAAPDTKSSCHPGRHGLLGHEGVRDVRGEQVTLSDGTMLTVPKSQAKLGELKAGTRIKATKKIVTSLQITEGPQTGGASK
jgi:hypothetical protein